MTNEERNALCNTLYNHSLHRQNEARKLHNAGNNYDSIRESARADGLTQAMEIVRSFQREPANQNEEAL